MILKNSSATALFILIFCSAFGQMDDYQYKRAISGIDEQWHQIELPDDIYSKLESNLSDIRIYGISPSGDTLEAPYLFNNNLGNSETKSVDFKIFNQSYTQDAYYYSFEIPKDKSINHIRLDFGNENFDWKLKLEGSQDQREWFGILDDYRILSINNTSTDYKFSTLNFPESNYKFYRVSVPAKSDPHLLAAQVSQIVIEEGKFKTLSNSELKIHQSKKDKQTEIIIDLPMLLPLNSININVNDDFDYYRPIRIETVNDSVKTEKGWRQITQNVGSGILSSIEENEFPLGGKMSKRLRIIVENGDNQALNFGDFSIEYRSYDLTARFNQEADYQLCYGNSRTRSPQYDIAMFKDKFPSEMSSLSLGPEVVLHAEIEKSSPLFENTNWLWAVMIVMILLLGWFSFKMLKNKQD